MHAAGSPSPWVVRWAHWLAPGSSLLDVACGRGRHVRWLAERGLRVTALDRDEQAVAPLRDVAEVIVADIEAQAWPCGERQFDAVLVTNYLWRPLWPTLLNSVKPGGLYLHETFAVGNESVGRPARPDFLLRRGELLRTCADWQVLAYEDGFATEPDRFVQRIVAVRPPDPAAARNATPSPILTSTPSAPPVATASPVRWPLAGQPPGAG